MPELPRPVSVSLFTEISPDRVGPERGGCNLYRQVCRLDRMLLLPDRRVAAHRDRLGITQRFGGRGRAGRARQPVGIMADGGLVILACDHQLSHRAQQGGLRCGQCGLGLRYVGLGDLTHLEPIAGGAHFLRDHPHIRLAQAHDLLRQPVEA